MSQPETTISIRAHTDCIVLRLTLEQFKNLVASQVEFLHAYLKQVSFNNIFLVNYSLCLGEKNTYCRLISALLLMAEYFGDPTPKGVRFRVIYTQQQLANMICLTRECLGKNLKQIRQKKLLTVGGEGELFITDLAAMRAELAMCSAVA